MPRKWDIWLISLTHRVAIDRDYLIVLVIEDRRRRAGLQLHWTAQVCALLGFIHALHYILRFIGLYMVTCIAVQCVLIFCINDAASYCTAFACTHAFKQDKCFAVQKDCPSGGWHSAADSLSNGLFSWHSAPMLLWQKSYSVVACTLPLYGKNITATSLVG